MAKITRVRLKVKHNDSSLEGVNSEELFYLLDRGGAADKGDGCGICKEFQKKSIGSSAECAELKR